MQKNIRNTLLTAGFALSLIAISTPSAADTATQDLTEARQETQIWTTYALSPHLRANDLKVSVDDGKATLTGTVDEDVSKDLAKQIAMGVDGVKSVDNQIVVQAGYTVPAPAAASGRSYGQAIDDATMTAAVKSKLLWSQSTEGFATDVDTRNAQVTLKGTADSAAAKALAGRLAANTRGVGSVSNQLVVKAPAKPGKAATAKSATQEAGKDVADGWITTKVKSTYLYSSNIDGSDIVVSTSGGIVTLSGKVDSGAERDLAVELAKNIRGVKSVQSTALVN